MSKKKKHNPLGAIIILILLIGSYLFFNFHSQKNNDLFSIDNVEIIGNTLISQEEIFTIIGDIKLDTLNNSEVKMIQNTLKSNNFIKEAWVKISHPSTLLIRIAEFEPEAILLDKKKHYLAADGIVYPYRFIDAYKEIPVISGVNLSQKDELKKTLVMLEILKEKPALFHLVSEICWEKDHLGLILTENGIRVKLPGNNWNETIFLLDRFIQRNFTKIKEKKYKRINLHYKNKIICS